MNDFTLLEKFPAAFTVINLDENRFLYVSTAFAALFSLPPDAARVFSPSALREKLHCAALPTLSGGAYDISYHAQATDGRHIFVRERGNVERNAAGGTLLYTTWEDATEADSALAQAMQASRAKSNFLFNMSHDIRTPMNGIIGMANIAIDEANDPDSVRYCLSRIESSSKHLLSLINDILDLSAIESDKAILRNEPFDLREMICGIVNILEPNIDNASHTLRIDVSALRHPYVRSDKLRLTQIFMNILANAIKFTPDGGHIRLEAEEIPDGSEQSTYRFRFRDTGIGMSEAFAARVFNSHEREHSAENIEGTGLGMAICKQLVTRMGGDISCQSRRGEGTTFTVTVPLAHSEPVAPERVIEDDMHLRDFSGMRVLVAEDIELNMTIAQIFLESLGIIVEQAWNGEEAVRLFADSPLQYYSLILMDIQMPVMDGCKAARTIRSMPRRDARSVPIIAMTADAFTEDVRRVLDAGMDAHVPKPLNKTQLSLAMGQCIDARSRR